MIGADEYWKGKEKMDSVTWKELLIFCLRGEEAGLSRKANM